MTFSKALYPPAAAYRFEGQELNTFRDDVDVAHPFTVDENVTEGEHTVRGKVHYQACTDGFPSALLGA